MEKIEAKKLVNKFIYSNNPSKEEENAFIKAADYLVEELNDVDTMITLGGYYYSKKKYPLAEAYYHLADQYDDEYAPLALGYIFFFGKNNEPDYEQALKYFLKAYERGNKESVIKIVDMYLNGIGTESNINKAKEILEKNFVASLNDNSYESIFPELLIRYIDIFDKQEKQYNLFPLLQKSKFLLLKRIKEHTSIYNVLLMKSVVTKLNERFDNEEYDVYDLLYLLTKHNKIIFYLNGIRCYFEKINEKDNEYIFDGSKKYSNEIEAFINFEKNNLHLFDYEEIYSSKILPYLN